MFRFPHHFRLTIALGAAAVLALAHPAGALAGWMGFRNDTTMTVLIQETVTAGPIVRQGKPQKVFANETVRDTPAAGGTRKFTIFDAAKPDEAIYTGNFPCPAATENVLFVIKSDGKGGLTIEATKTPTMGTTPVRPKK